MIYDSVIFTDQPTGQWDLCTVCLLHTQKGKAKHGPSTYSPWHIPTRFITEAISASTPLQTWAFFPWIPAATLQCNTQRQNHRRYSSWLCTLSYSEALAALSSLIHLHVNMIILNELQTRFNCKNISSF